MLKLANKYPNIDPFVNYLYKFQSNAKLAVKWYIVYLNYYVIVIGFNSLHEIYKIK